MMSHSRIAAFLIAICFLTPSGLPAAELPSHCRTGEFGVLNAQVGKIDAKGHKTAVKTVSLCADRAKEPFQRLVYRYGRVGNVEMEVTATPTSKFVVFDRYTTPRSGEVIVGFRKGDYAYYVVEAIGMASGVFVYVYKGDRKLAELKSGFDPDFFKSDLIMLNVDKPTSPVFVRQAPKHHW